MISEIAPPPSSCVQRIGRGQRKRQPTPEWFNKQENLLIRLVLGSHRTSRSLHLPTSMLKVYIEALAGFSHVLSPDSPIITLVSHGWILGAVSGKGKARRMYFPCSSSLSAIRVVSSAYLRLLILLPAILIPAWPRPSEQDPVSPSVSLSH